MAALSLLYPGSLVQLLSRQTTARVFSCPRYFNCHLTLHNSSVCGALVPRSFTPPSTFVRRTCCLCIWRVLAYLLHRPGLRRLSPRVLSCYAYFSLLVYLCISSPIYLFCSVSSLPCITYYCFSLLWYVQKHQVIAGSREAIMKIKKRRVVKKWLYSIQN